MDTRGRHASVRRRISAWLFLPAAIIVLAACGGGGGGGGGGSGSDAQSAAVPSTTVTVNALGVAPTTVSGSVVASGATTSGLTFSLAQAPTEGTASVNASTGAFTYTLAGHPNKSTDTFTVAVTGGSSPGTATVNVIINTDPLLANQWHIRNTGQSAFSTIRPSAGHDLNVAAAWAAGYSGKGIRVGVVDTGLEVAHEDLAPNVDAGLSFNFVNFTNDPTPPANQVGTDHGTQVAGIIGAVAFNGKGGRGVAYNARLRGFNLLENFSDQNYARAFGGLKASEDIDVFNASFGAGVQPILPPLNEAQIAVSVALTTMRGGRGAILVNSASNRFQDFPEGDPTACNQANAFGVSCGDPAMDTRLGGYTPILAAALDADGKRSSYSTAGSSVWISAPGGEYGYDSAFYNVSRFKFPEFMIRPAIISTARTGCQYRQDAPDTDNALQTGTHPAAPLCQYTAQMNGTSSASPNTAAVVAMMLEANPNLSYRDVKFILAKTARQVDSNYRAAVTTNLIVGATITLEQGWFRNAAGYNFSNWYGFGAVDAAAAVAMAKDYKSPLPPLVSSGRYESNLGPNITVEPFSPTGYTINIPVVEAFRTVEHVVVFLNLEVTDGLFCNQVELVSPSGTKSILFHAVNGFRQRSATNARLGSNAFYGEPINGNWRLNLYNFCGGTTRLSPTVPQGIQWVGH